LKNVKMKKKIEEVSKEKSHHVSKGESERE
jgi:hypothetical protein